ncbi:MAG: M67 family metallopeptidase, partial [Chloroflexota bacterium]
MRSLRLSAQQIQVILKAVDNAYPHEACGIIGGQDGDAIRIIPIANVAENRERHYRLDPEEQLQALLSLEAEHLEWIGVFHSHPDGKPIPSLDDIQDARLNTPNLIHLIVGMRNRQPELQAWHINNGQVDPVDL